MLFEIETDKSLEQIDAGIRAAAANHKFGVLGVHDLREAMANKGVAFENTCLVYEVCNPHQAKKILERNSGFSSLLPCRISVYGLNGRTKLSTVLPTELAKLFGGAELEPIALEVEEAVKSIMEETAR